jgi:hypothetical protein
MTEARSSDSYKSLAPLAECDLVATLASVPLPAVHLQGHALFVFEKGRRELPLGARDRQYRHQLQSQPLRPTTDFPLSMGK